MSMEMWREKNDSRSQGGGGVPPAAIPVERVRVPGKKKKPRGHSAAEPLSGASKSLKRKRPDGKMEYLYHNDYFTTEELTELFERSSSFVYSAIHRAGRTGKPLEKILCKKKKRTTQTEDNRTDRELLEEWNRGVEVRTCASTGCKETFQVDPTTRSRRYCWICQRRVERSYTVRDDAANMIPDRAYRPYF